MIFYNWPLIYKVAEANTKECMRIFKMHVTQQVPKNRYDPLYKYRHFVFYGKSYLLNPETLLFNAYKYSNYDLCIYLSLAALRSYAEYRALGNTTLDLIKAPVNPHFKVEATELMPIKDGKIYFLYENVIN